MKHRNFIHKLIATVVCILSISPAFAYDIEVDGIYYNITSTTDLTCEVAQGRSKYSGKVIIPAQIEYKSKTLTVTSIGWAAFDACSSLESIELPNSVTSIDYAAFSGCKSLQSVKLSNSLTGIGSQAFDGCSSLESIELPNSLIRIGSWAFDGCSSLKSIELPNSVTSIGELAFNSCRSLQAIKLSNSLTTIEQNAFEGCSSLESIELPNTVETLGACAFRYCSKLEQIKLSDSLTRLNYGTFDGCKSLKSITIPSNIKQIVISYNYSDDFIFDGCPALINIEYSPNILKFYTYVKNYSIRELYDRNNWANVEKLSIDRNFNCKMVLRDLKELTIGEHVETLDVYKLNDLSKLESITSYAVTPPTIPSCTTKQYTDLVVKVPKGCLEAYQNASVWKNFWNISEMEDASTGIDDVIVDQPKKELGRYNMQGNRVGDDYKGIVIVKYSDGTTSKIINK